MGSVVGTVGRMLSQLPYFKSLAFRISPSYLLLFGS